MTVGDIKHQINTGEFNRWYIFTGEEIAVMKIYIKMISDKSGLPIHYVSSYADVYGDIHQSGLIKTNYLYVILDDKEFISSEKAQNSLDRIKDDIVIFYYTSADKRLKFWKKFQNLVVEFEHLTDSILVKYIQRDIDLNESNCQKLIDICEHDYSRILLEIDKIKHFMDKRQKMSCNDAFLKLLDDGVIYMPPHDAIFDFVNAVLARNGRKALKLLDESYAVGEANMVLLSVMYNSFRNLLQVQTCKNTDISKSTGLTGWQIKNVKPFVDNYSVGELIRILRLIQKAESGIKSGTMPDEWSTYYVLGGIL